MALLRHPPSGFSALLLGLAAVFVDAVEHLAHIFDLLEESVGDVDGTLLSGGQSEAIAGASINFDNLASQFVLLLQDQPCEIGRVFEFGNNDAFDGDAEAFEDALDEVDRSSYEQCMVEILKNKPRGTLFGS